MSSIETPASSASRARWAPFRSGSSTSMPSCERAGSVQARTALEHRPGLDLHPAPEVDHACRWRRGGSPARGSPRSRGRPAARPRPRSRARRSRAPSGRCRRRSARPGRATPRRGSGRRRSAPRRCRSGDGGARSTRAGSTRRSSRSAPAGRRSRRSVSQSRNGEGTPQRGKVRVKISVRTVCRPVSRRSRKGELAETASSSGSSSRIRSQTAIARSAPRTPMWTCMLQVLLRWATQPSSWRSRL